MAGGSDADNGGVRGRAERDLEIIFAGVSADGTSTLCGGAATDALGKDTVRPVAASIVSAAPAVALSKVRPVVVGVAKVPRPLLIGQAICNVCPAPPGTRLHVAQTPVAEATEIGSPEVNEKLGGVLACFAIAALITSKLVTFAVSQPCREMMVGDVVAM